MVDSASMNMMGRCVTNDTFMENLKLLDFPMESVDESIYEEEEDENWNEKLQSSLGPIPVDYLTRCLNGNIANASEFMLNGPGTVTDERGSEPKLPPRLIKKTSITKKSKSVQPLSPISVLDSSNSRPLAIHIPKRARTKRPRPSKLKTYTFIVFEKEITKKKRKTPEKKTITTSPTTTPTLGGSKRCSHCQVTQTPQWREGPMGPKTLCNACGVRYRSGRLFPEYRPMASPGFVPTLHSNSHRKVLEMRNKGTMKLDDNGVGESAPPVLSRRRVKKAPVYERENSPPPEFIPMSDYLLDCVLGGEVFNY